MAKTNDPRLALAQSASAAVQKKFRSGVSASARKILVRPTGWISFGNWVLDLLTCGYLPGGVPIRPRGSIVHIAGKYGSAKSALLDHLVLSAQQQGGYGLISECEGARSNHFAQAIGVNPDLCEIQLAPDFNHLFDMGLAYIANIRALEDERQRRVPKHKREYAPIVWGLDSIKAMEARTAGKAMTESAGAAYGGGVSQALDTGLKKLLRESEIHPTTFVMLNQTRIDPSIMFGDKDTTPGGNPPHFYSSIELKLRPAFRKGGPVVFGKYAGAPMSARQRQELGLSLKVRGNPIGLWVRAQVTKTRLGRTIHKEGVFYLDFDKGIHPVKGLFGFLANEGIVRFDGDRVVHRLPNNKKKTFEDQRAWERWIKIQGLPPLPNGRL